MTVNEKYEKIIDALQEKKAKDIVTIDIDKITTIANFFIICSGNSTTHIKALSDFVDEKLKPYDISYYRKEGYDTARWILLDYGDIVVHIFHEEERNFYSLDRLWRDGKIVKHGDGSDVSLK